MTEIEEKSFKAQLELYKEVCDADRMIIHTVQSSAQTVYDNIISPKMYFKSDQKTVELSVEEFTTIRLLLGRLSSNDGFKELNSWISDSYIKPKEEKVKIISMLR